MKKKQKAVYVSTDSSVLSVDEVNTSSRRATITAVAIGSAHINVTVKKGKRVVKRLKCRVKISPNAVSLKFPKKTVKLHPTEQIQLDPIIKPITSTEQPVFESDDTEVATVSSRGMVTALSPGIVTITATLLSTNQTAECTIIVEEPDEPEEKPEQKPKVKSVESEIENEYC